MRTALKWALILSTCASAVALLWPADEEPTEGTLPASGIPRANVAPAIDLPALLPPQTLLATKKDPFASLPIAKLSPSTSVGPVMAPPPEPPRAPPMTYRYLGSFTAPDGAREIYLTRGDRTVAVRQGSQLDGGYQVEAISATAVNVLHAATQTRVDIPIAQNKESP